MTNKKKIKQFIGIIGLLTFVCLSIYYIHIPTSSARSTIQSAQLSQISEKEDGFEKRSFVDKSGMVTFAADAGYAFMTITDTDSGMIEKYYDENGNPVEQTGNYYAVCKKIDNMGRNNITTYLDQYNSPTIITTGFSTSVRTYYNDGKIETEKYYDTSGNPVRTNGYGFGKKIEYDKDGNIGKIAFLDENGSVSMTSLGYAIITRTYYKTDGAENGKIKYEFYYDKCGNPVSRSLGQYGIYKKYNFDGTESSITYVDAYGQPITTTKGYTTVLYSYNSDNTIVFEKYFDEEGKPVSLSEGQYGIKKQNGKTIYLDADGNELLNVKQLIQNNSHIIIIFAMTLAVLSVILGKRLNILLLVLYLCVIIYMTLMFRERTSIQISMKPFWAYKQFFTDRSVASDIIKNVWLFIPLGVIINRIYMRKNVGISLVVFLSTLIEGIQFFVGIGFCELDDVISNSLGGIIGYMIGHLFGNLKRQVEALDNSIPKG